MNLTMQNEPWQIALKNVITHPQELLERLQLDISLLDAAQKAAAVFPLKVTESYLSRIKKSDKNDPLLKQILPLGIETEKTPGYTDDPLKEADKNPIPGLLHKYNSRVLLTLVGSCAINCRYCFRKHFPYEKNNPGTSGWEKALDYIEKDTSIKEIILSGGDPLIASDYLLKNFSDKLINIPHIKRLRIHSRIPVVLPERITQTFIQWISTIPLQTILVVHINHPNEIDDSVKQAIHALREAGITLLNQSVLLKGVNDDVETLVKLSEILFSVNILPYYLHLLDKVQGTAHFDMDRERAKELHWELSQRLSGFLVPKLVFEKAGEPAKLLVTG